MELQRKSQVLNRLKSIQGHLHGVQRMVEEDQYCIDIIRQTMAVQKAIDKVNAIILENHLQTCVARALRGDNAEERERVVAELLQLYEGGASVGLNRHIQAIPFEGSPAEAPVEATPDEDPPIQMPTCPHCGSSISLAGGTRE